MTDYTQGFIAGLMVGCLLGAVFFTFAVVIVYHLARRVGAIPED